MLDPPTYLSRKIRPTPRTEMRAESGYRHPKGTCQTGTGPVRSSGAVPKFNIMAATCPEAVACAAVSSGEFARPGVDCCLQAL